MKRIYRASIDCANCAAKIEKAIRSIKGVNEASVNFMAGKITLDADDALFAYAEKEMVRVAKRIEPDCEIIL